MASLLHGLRPGDSDDDDSMAGAGESERPQRADIMLLIRPSLFVKDDRGISAVHPSSLAPPLCVFAGGCNAEGLLGDTDCT